MGTVTEKLEKVLDTKAAIRDAIIGKGQTVTDTDPFSSYPAKITAIQTGADTSDATATAGDILSGKTAYAKGAKVTGTIAAKTASDLTASGATVSVPAGYYASQVAKSVAKATQDTPSISVDANGKITASMIQTAGYVSAGAISATQQLSTQAAQTITPGTAAKTAVPVGKYTTGEVTVAGDVNLVAENIKSGVSIFGVEGAVEEGVDTTDATAVAGDILSGKTAYVDGKKVTGTIISQAATTITPGTTAKTAVAAKRYTTGLVQVAGSANLKAANIKSGVTIFGVKGTYEAPSDITGVSVTISPANSIKSYSVVYPSSASELSGEFDATTAKTLTTYGALVIAVQKQSGTTASLNASVSGGVSALITMQSCVILPTSSNVNVTIS